MGDSFTHLHVHTEYSMLDGAARVDAVVAAAVADGQPAIGITDHGNMYGVLDFYEACRKQGVKPIIGSEAYMAHDHRTERLAVRGKVDDTGGEGEGGKKPYYHLTLLAETNVGYKNLIQLASRAFLEGYYRKPKVDWELLDEHHEGLIATSGCLGGHVLQSLLRNDFDDALKRAGRLQDIFGRDSFFIEIQDHGIPDQHRTNPQLVDIARMLQAPLLATNDSHYVSRADAKSHDALLCVQTGALMSDTDRFKFHSDEHYLKSAAEMRSLFGELPESCDNTLWIAERCDVEIEFGKPQLPSFPLPAGFASDDEYLRHLTFEGARQRWGADLPDTVVERLAYELQVIRDMGFSSYFLIVWDLIRHARDAHIRVGPGRGSAAGCAVAYCLRITDLDPIRYDLLFERFLNPSRISMPDIDMDFDSRYRDEMIRYAAEKYGRDHVAQIVTFSQIKARAAVRDAARVLGYPYVVGDKIAKAMPPLVMGRDTPLYACLEPHPKFDDGYKMAAELRQMYHEDPDVKAVVDVARGLEGLRRQDGIHAAAVVITKEPLTEYLPIQRKPEPGQDPEQAPVVTQYEMHGVEELGLLKMDFLGLRNLDVITDTIELIRHSRGVELDIDTIPLDDEHTLAMLRRGDSIGVFQLEGGPMRALMRSLAPTSFDDVAALVALYRPGPMAANMHNDYADRKNGRKPVESLHPDLDEVLGTTYQLMIFQESVMRVAQKVAGYTLAEADNLRKACLPRGTLMLTKARGYVPIEEVMRLADRRVHTIDTASCASRFEPVADVWSVGTKAVFRLTTSTGYTIEATANHPFLVDDEWVELGQIQPGDLVAVAGHTHTDGGATTSTAEVELSALQLAAGCTPDARPHHRADLGNSDPLSVDERIPTRILNAPRHKVARFLGLYFCAAGWADRAGAHFTSKSKALCLGVKRLLLRFGIVSDLHHQDVRGYGTHWTLSVADTAHAKTFAALVEPHLSEVKAAKVDRWLREWEGRGSATGIGSGRLEDLRTGDLLWDTVTSIEYAGEVECFDFRMENADRPYAVVEDFLVHNCGKKIRELIAKEREKFVEGCKRTGYGRELGERLFDIIEPFADYAFNKSHAYGYGLIAYQTAYLKAHYPVEYVAALLTSVKANLDKAAVYLAECRAMGIDVLVPDVNVSESDFIAVPTPEGSESPGSIPFGLSAVRNVGTGLVSLILAERATGGPFADFYDFCERVDLQVLNKRTIESLVKAGGFDSLGHPRLGLLQVFEQIIDQTVARRRERDQGVMSLFGEAAGEEAASAFDERVPIPEAEFDKTTKLANEKEMLGLYVSDHPLMGLEAALRRLTECSIADLAERGDGDIRTVGGVVTSLQRKYTKKGDLMGVFVLEDLERSIEVMVFPRTMQEYGHLLTDDAVVCVKGRVDGRDDTPKLMAMDITRPELTAQADTSLHVRVPLARLTQALVDRLKGVLSEHPGPAEVFLHVGEKQIRLPPEFRVDTRNGLVAELRELLGPDAIAA